MFKSIAKYTSKRNEERLTYARNDCMNVIGIEVYQASCVLNEDRVRNIVGCLCSGNTSMRGSTGNLYVHEPTYSIKKYIRYYGCQMKTEICFDKCDIKSRVGWYVHLGYHDIVV